LRFDAHHAQQGAAKQRRRLDRAPAADQKCRGQEPVLSLHDIGCRTEGQECRGDDQPAKIGAVGFECQRCAARQLEEDVGGGQRQHAERQHQQQKTWRINPGPKREGLDEPPAELGIEMSGKGFGIEDQREMTVEIGASGAVKRQPVGPGPEQPDSPRKHQ
jgi:hypothetical protein